MKNNEVIRIAIAETSVIIRGGLTAALKRLPNAKVQPIELLSAEALHDCLRTQCPEMLIVNPTFGDYFDYGFLHFPCNSGILPMLLATLCLVLASQGMGILMIGTLPTLRLGLSFASLWGVLSFSMCGLSFPAMGMHPVLQALANLFPLRHYFLIYVDQALNGYPMIYSWVNYVALLIFMMLPFLIAHRLKGALVYYKYMP